MRFAESLRSEDGLPSPHIRFPQCGLGMVAEVAEGTAMADKRDTGSGRAGLLTVLRSVGRFSGRLGRGSVDLTRPRTEIGRLKQEIEASLEQLDRAAVLSELRDLLRTITPDGIVRALAELPR